MPHIPVMTKETLEYLNPQPNQNFIDCTIGDGGHARALLERTAPEGRLLGIDLDPEAVANVKLKMQNEKLLDRVVLANDNFKNLASIIEENDFHPIHGILLDIGFSASTLERGRGFSFDKDEPLDMRFNPKEERHTAANIINSWRKEELQSVFSEYGEEKLSGEIAAAIVLRRKREKILTTNQLVEIILETYRRKLAPKVSSRVKSRNLTRFWEARSDISHPAQNDRLRIPWIGGLHPATRVFQSLRITVNEELQNLQEVLPKAIDVLEPGGKLAVIAFHSLEDRIVKQFFRSEDGKSLEIITKKPITASFEEIKANIKARSAKLRVVEKIIS